MCHACAIVPRRRAQYVLLALIIEAIEIFASALHILQVGGEAPCSATLASKQVQPFGGLVRQRCSCRGECIDMARYRVSMAGEAFTCT